MKIAIVNDECYVNSDWMHGPMGNVNPDEVENEVGNFWRSLYKLEKQFDSVPQAKKIASKVKCQHVNSNFYKLQTRKDFVLFCISHGKKKN
jgi:hypothetical protein